jgi:transcriptional pleiotropic regulator of transition state genes
MKATGITRKVDDLGRVVLPIEIRRSMHINNGNYIEIFVTDDSVVLKKYDPVCTFTGSADDLVEYMGRKVSKKAIQELVKAAEASN